MTECTLETEKWDVDKSYHEMIRYLNVNMVPREHGHHKLYISLLKFFLH